MKRNPKWNDFHRIGSRIVEEVEGVMTFQEIGDELGITRNLAYHLCCVAVGKVVFRSGVLKHEKSNNCFDSQRDLAGRAGNARWV